MLSDRLQSAMGLRGLSAGIVKVTGLMMGVCDVSDESNDGLTSMSHMLPYTTRRKVNDFSFCCNSEHGWFLFR